MNHYFTIIEKTQIIINAITNNLNALLNKQSTQRTKRKIDGMMLIVFFLDTIIINSRREMELRIHSMERRKLEMVRCNVRHRDHRHSNRVRHYPIHRDPHRDHHRDHLHDLRRDHHRDHLRIHHRDHRNRLRDHLRDPHRNHLHALRRDPHRNHLHDFHRVRRDHLPRGVREEYEECDRVRAVWARDRRRWEGEA